LAPPIDFKIKKFKGIVMKNITLLRALCALGALGASSSALGMIKSVTTKLGKKGRNAGPGVRSFYDNFYHWVNAASNKPSPPSPILTEALPGILLGCSAAFAWGSLCSGWSATKSGFSLTKTLALKKIAEVKEILSVDNETTAMPPEELPRSTELHIESKYTKKRIASELALCITCAYLSRGSLKALRVYARAL
jgi:hypothetical protein